MSMEPILRSQDTLTASRTSKVRHNAIRSAHDQYDRVARWFETTDDRNPKHEATWYKMQELYLKLPSPEKEWTREDNQIVSKFKEYFRTMQVGLNNWEKKQP